MMMAYEEFRDKIANELRKAQEPLTWTEIRTRAQLPQKYPNNRWTHLLENDIALERKHIHGVMRWQLR